MSIRVMASVWDQVDVDGTLLLLLLALADHANDAGACYPSVATLGRKIRRSRARTFEALAELEQRGLLARDPCPGRTCPNHHGRTTHYRLQLPEGPALRTVQSAGRSSVPDGEGPALRTLRVQPAGHKPSGNHQGTVTPLPPSRRGGRRRARFSEPGAYEVGE